MKDPYEQYDEKYAVGYAIRDLTWDDMKRAYEIKIALGFEDDRMAISVALQRLYDELKYGAK